MLAGVSCYPEGLLCLLRVGRSKLLSCLPAVSTSLWFWVLCILSMRCLSVCQKISNGPTPNTTNVMKLLDRVRDLPQTKRSISAMRNCSWEDVFFFFSSLITSKYLFVSSGRNCLSGKELESCKSNMQNEKQFVGAYQVICNYYIIMATISHWAMGKLWLWTHIYSRGCQRSTCLVKSNYRMIRVQLYDENVKKKEYP